MVPFGGRAARGLRASGEVSLSVAPPGGGNIVSVPVHLAGSPTSGLRDYIPLPGWLLHTLVTYLITIDHGI